MTVTLYKCNNPSNTIGKTCQGGDVVTDVFFKSQTDIINPVLTLKKDDTIFNYNYAFIEQLKRYYFINDIKVFPNNIYEVQLSIDVLQTYKDDILNGWGTVRQQSNVNPYYNSGYQSEVRTDTTVYKSDTSITTGSNIVLVTIGGV